MSPNGSVEVYTNKIKDIKYYSKECICVWYESLGGWPSRMRGMLRWMPWGGVLRKHDSQNPKCYYNKIISPNQML